jgi:hypothetical protein
MTLDIGEPEFPVGGDSADVADWAELLVIGRRKPLTHASLSRVAEREGGGIGEDVIDSAWESLGDRARLHGSRWPFQLADDTLAPSTPRADLLALYTFLCLLSFSGEVEHAGRRLFEHCVSDLVVGLTNGPALRLGAPRIAPVPTGFEAAVTYYGTAGDEKIVARLVDPDHEQDGGLDVASWFPFDDSRGCYLHLIGQCATGANWLDKTRDLTVDRWYDYIQWGLRPVPFLAIPRVILSNLQLRRVTKEAGLVLDRPRLLELCSRKPLSDERRLKVEQYCQQLLPAA